jgi:hypothetical protein
MPGNLTAWRAWELLGAARDQNGRFAYSDMLATVLALTGSLEDIVKIYTIEGIYQNMITQGYHGK